MSQGGREARAKLPLWATVKEAYRAIGANLPLLLRFAAVPFVLFLAADLCSYLLVSAAYPYVREFGVELPFTEEAAAHWLGRISATLVLIPFAVQCYRLFLLGRDGVAKDGLYRIGRESRGMLIVVIYAILVFDIPLEITNSYLDPESYAYLSALVIVSVIFFYFSVRLIFLVPAICLVEPWRLMTRWRQTRGNFWRLLGALTIALLPLYALYVAALYGFDFPSLPNLAEQSGSLLEDPELLMFVLLDDGLDTVLALVDQVLTSAVVVIAFAVLTAASAAGATVPRRSAD